MTTIERKWNSAEQVGQVRLDCRPDGAPWWCVAAGAWRRTWVIEARVRRPDGLWLVAHWTDVSVSEGDDPRDHLDVLCLKAWGLDTLKSTRGHHHRGR